MIIDSRNKRLIKKTIVDLTPTQTKLLLLFSDNKIHSLKEIADYLETTKKTAALYIWRTNKKIDMIEIINLKDKGYKLKNEIYVI